MPVPLSCPIKCTCHLEDFDVRGVKRDVQMLKDYRSYIIKCGTLSKMNPPLVTQGSFMEETQTNYSCVPCGILSLSPVRRTSLVSQMVKNLPVVWEPRVQSLGWEDPLKKAMATHSSILAWRIQWMRSLTGYSLLGHKESDTTERLTYTYQLEVIWSLFVILADVISDLSLALECRPDSTHWPGCCTWQNCPRVPLVGHIGVCRWGRKVDTET